MDLPDIDDFTVIYEKKSSLGSMDSGSTNSLTSLGSGRTSSSQIFLPEANLNNKEKKLQDQETKRKEREAKREEKERVRKEKENERKLKRSVKPGECLKYIVVEIDRQLLERLEGSEIISKMLAMDLQYKATDQKIPFSISFSRIEPLTGHKKVEKELIVIVPLKEFLLQVHCQIYGKDASSEEEVNSLFNICQKWKSVISGSNITIIVCGLEDFFKEKKSQNRSKLRENVLKEVDQTKRKKKIKSDSYLSQVTRIDIETAMVTIQIELEVNIRLLSNPTKVAEFTGQLAKAVAERPYKIEKESTNFSWYAEGSNINCVKVDKTGAGLLRLWQQQLRQFNNVGPEMAQAIVNEYSSPQNLLQMYRTLPSKDAIKLLADIPVRRGVGVLANTRRVGAELSKKIYTFFMETDSNVCL